MRQIILLLVFSLAVGCNQPTKKKNNESQTQEKVVIPTSLLGKDWEGNEILVGRVTYAQMTQYTEAWFNKEYDFYRINEERLEKIKPLLKDKRVVLIMGTWCEDSQREVPGMMKILNQAGFNTAEMEIIAIDEDKRTKEGLEKAYNLAYIPALIFFEGDKEMNRIVEFPINSLEQDILDILSSKEYKNAYAQ
ncbi:MAG: thioredoxin family protein [Flavobacteriaceae bacterium]